MRRILLNCGLATLVSANFWITYIAKADQSSLSIASVGMSQLRVLSPNTLELELVNTKLPDPAVVTNWNLVDITGGLILSAISPVSVLADGLPVLVQNVGFKRRPVYAPLASYDLRINNCLYIQLATPIADNQMVQVINLDGTLWSDPNLFSTIADPMRESPAIHVNQEGYVPSLPKKAIIGYYLGSLGELQIPASSGFSIVDATTGAVVFQGGLTPRADVGYNYTPAPYQVVMEADFSAFTTSGRYRLMVPGLGVSLPFLIDDGIVMAFARTYALGIYHQRCGTNNALPFSRFTHDPCHIAPASIPMPPSAFSFTWNTVANYATVADSDNPPQIAPKLTSAAAQLYPFINTGVVDVSGGHHDAGDYSKYTINSAAFIHALMFAVDSLPGVASLDNLGIPESGDGISDLMQEAKWESDFLAKMQDADGGFYFLVYPRNREYENNVLPDHGDPQVVWPKTTSVTAAGVAALAQCSSSPLFRRTYPETAADYLAKAQLGWRFLTNAIAIHGKNGAYQKITHYGDDFTHNDELAWAACEMFLATGDPAYQQTLMGWFPNPGDPSTFRWSWWRLYGSYGNAIRSYSFAARSGRLGTNQLDAAYLSNCVAQVIAAGNDALTWSQKNAYGTSFPVQNKGPKTAGWYFSTDQAFDMSVAYQLNPRPEYVDGLLRNMNYEGGCNPVNVTFVTGLGLKRQREIVSQYAQNDRRVLPPDGIPLGNIQLGFLYDPTYGNALSALTFPSDAASNAPYPFYDRWGDTYNVTTEFVAVNQARSLGSLAFLAATASVNAQPWTPVPAQIAGLPARVSTNASVNATVSVPGMDLNNARIIWESHGNEPSLGPAFGASFTDYGTQWIEVEVQLPDGRRAFAATNILATNGLPIVNVLASKPNASKIGPSSGEFTLTRDGDTSDPLVVHYLFAGTAVKWTDYRNPLGTLPDYTTIPAGSSSATITLIPVFNGFAEGTTSVILVLTTNALYNVGAGRIATVYIADNVANITGISVQTSGDIAINWDSQPGTVYQVWHKDAVPGSWMQLSGDLVADGGETMWVDSTAMIASQRFYRVFAIR